MDEDDEDKAGTYLSKEEAAKLEGPDTYCRNCLFWDQVEPPTWTSTCSVTWTGWCHRFPPIYRNNEVTSEEDYWQPITRHNDWCGEFQPHPPGSV